MAGERVADVLTIERLIFEFQQDVEPPSVGEHFEPAREAVDVLAVFFDECIKCVKEDTVVQIGWRFIVIV